MLGQIAIQTYGLAMQQTGAWEFSDEGAWQFEVASADGDITLEVRITDEGFVLGVQDHPETGIPLRGLAHLLAELKKLWESA